MNVHESLIPTDNSSIEIETTAEVLKPIVGFIHPLVDECRIHFRENEVFYESVDSANVALEQLTVDADAFERYDVDETTIGVNISNLKTALRAGRQKKSDQITLSVENDTLSTVVKRDYDGTAMDLQNNIRLIDPDSIREQPDYPDIDLPATATVPRMLLKDVFKQVKTHSEHLEMATEDTELVISGKSDLSSATAVVDNVVESDEDVTSMFSLDYLHNDCINALTAIGANEISIELGTEFPMNLKFETELNGAEVSGVWMQAPRVQSE